MKSWMSLAKIKRFIPEMKRLGVSKVARSKRGFLTAYTKARGSKAKIGPWWRNRRDNFVKRHMAQAKHNNERLWIGNGRLSRRGLALVAWAALPPKR
jgi:hypothetical protein